MDSTQDRPSLETCLGERHLFIFAGEASGDKLGAALIEQLLKIRPDLKITAVAGPMMRNYPITTLLPMEEFQVMGFVAVLFALPKLLKHFKQIKHFLLKTPSDAAVLIDYPGFNLRMAKHLRKSGFKKPLIHYVCPSVWAWKKNRVHTMSQTLNLLLSIFPFEKECFANTSLPVEYIGHPLATTIHHFTPRSSFPSFDKPLLAIFPGSRSHEIIKNFPLQLKAAIDLAYNDYSIVVSCAHPHLKPLIQKEIDKYKEHHIHLLSAEWNYDLMHRSHLALATSGTITLELALHQVPTLVTYGLNALDFFLANKIFKIHLPHYCIANYVAGLRMFPEFYGPQFNPQMLYATLSSMLKHPEELTLCKERCQAVKKLLYTPRPSEEAATLVLKHLSVEQ